MKKKISILLAAALGASLLFGACGAAESNETSEAGSNKSETQEASAEELIPVRIAACSATAQFTEGALLAQNLGYIDEELAAVGYEPEYIGFAGAGPAINEAFAAGEIDYAFYAEFPAITANSNGVDITVIGAANSEYHYALLAREGSGISSGADMAGKKIIVTPGTILYKYFAELCEASGISVDDVEVVNALSDAQTLLASGDADGLIISYSGALLYSAMGLGEVVEDTTADINSATGLMLAGRTEFVEENPEVNKALIRALYRAYLYAKENPDEVYALLETESTPVSVLQDSYAYDTSFEYFNPTLTDSYLERAGKVYDFANENQLLGSEEVDLNKIFDNSYVEEVIAEFE